MVNRSRRVKFAATVAASLTVVIAAFASPAGAATDTSDPSPGAPVVATDQSVTETPASASCGTGTTVVTPSDPDQGLDASAGAPAASAIIDKANAQGATWLSDPQCVSVPTTEDSEGVAGPAMTSTASDTSSLNWSGYYSVGGSGGTPDYVTADWTVPNVTWSAGGTNYSSIWTGLGGWGNTHLVQTGTESDQTKGDSQVNYFWWEILPANQTKVTNFPIHNGDKVGSSTYFHNYVATFVMCDYTTNQCLDVDKNETAYTPGATADFIVERTEVNGNYPVLADFGTLNFTNAQYETTAGSLHNPAHGGYSIDMYDVNSLHLAHTQPASGEDITVVWKHGGAVSKG